MRLPPSNLTLINCFIRPLSILKASLVAIWYFLKFILRPIVHHLWYFLRLDFFSTSSTISVIALGAQTPNLSKCFQLPLGKVYFGFLVSTKDCFAFKARFCAFSIIFTICATAFVGLTRHIVTHCLVQRLQFCKSEPTLVAGWCVTSISFRTKIT